MGISDRWISFLYRGVTGTRKTRTLLTPIGALIFTVFIALFVILAVLVDRLLALPWPVANVISWFVSVSLMAIGVATTAWSAFHFLRAKGTPVPFNPPPTLVTTGPYRFSRNPMLSGVFFLLLGIGFAIRSLSLVVLFTPLFVLVNIWELKEIEEPELVKRLGKAYIAYRERTPMFIPGSKIRK
jgi:protein-S-isoprenylcysteine O-methyltransferase Ste14